jgi:magnesium transporter
MDEASIGVDALSLCYTSPMSHGKQGFPSVKTGNLQWVYVDRNLVADMNALRRKYRYSPLDLKEVLPPLQRPKVVARDGYLFLILHYPIYDPKTRDVRATEIDFFISADRLVTVNVDNYAPLRTLFRSCADARMEKVCMQGDMTQLLYALLSDMTADVFSMLVHINNDLDAIEKRMFAEFERNLIQELLRVKTNIANVRKAMQSHQTVIRNLMRETPRYFPIHQLQDYFDELVDNAREIWETLEIQKQTVDALHETNQSLIDFRINEIIKTLTIFSVIVFPLTLMAAIFGMNVKMPLVEGPYGFWLIMGLMILGVVGMLAFFKNRKWL